MKLFEIGAKLLEQGLFPGGIVMAKELPEDKPVQHVRLEHTNGHYKFYELHLHRLENGWFRVTGVYGKIGAVNPTIQVKDTTKSLNEAQATFNKVKQEKLDKGYKIVKLDHLGPVKTAVIDKILQDDFQKKMDIITGTSPAKAKPNAPAKTPLSPEEEEAKTRFDLDLD